MAQIQLPAPVKLFVGILSADTANFLIAQDKLTAVFGPVDLSSNPAGIPFTFSDYYTKEMGPELKKLFLSFTRLINPDELAAIKIKTNQIEEILAQDIKGALSRPVNLDPGYLTASKVLLATTKDYSHRIYLRDGIYAEITLQYKTLEHGRKGFQPLPWTYQDYKTQPYLDFFDEMRNIYFQQTSIRMK
jgi:hypothetical protein